MYAVCYERTGAVMADVKYRPTGESVPAFLDNIPNPTRRQDAKLLCVLVERALGEPPQIWASSMVGFGHYHYRYASGHEGDAGAAGFAPRASHRET